MPMVWIAPGRPGLVLDATREHALCKAAETVSDTAEYEPQRCCRQAPVDPHTNAD